MERTCWTRGCHVHSKDPIRQVFTGGRDVQDRCQRQIQAQQGRGCGRRGRRRSRGHGTRGRTARRALDQSRPTRNTPLNVACDPGEPTTKERDDHNATHIPFRSWCPILRQSERKGRGAQKWQRKAEEL